MVADKTPAVVNSSLTVADKSCTVTDSFGTVTDSSCTVTYSFSTVTDKSYTITDSSCTVIDSSCTVFDKFCKNTIKTRKTICQLDTVCIMTRSLTQKLSFNSYHLDKGCNLTTKLITQAEALPLTSVCTFCFFNN